MRRGGQCRWSAKRMVYFVSHVGATECTVSRRGRGLLHRIRGTRGVYYLQAISLMAPALSPSRILGPSRDPLEFFRPAPMNIYSADLFASIKTNKLKSLPNAERESIMYTVAEFDPLSKLHYELGFYDPPSISACN